MGSDSEFMYGMGPCEPNSRTGQEQVHIEHRAPSSLSSKVNSPIERIARVPVPARQTESQSVSQLVTARPPGPPSCSPQNKRFNEPSLLISSDEPTRDKHAKLRGSLWIRVAAKHGDYSCTPFFPNPIQSPPNPCLCDWPTFPARLFSLKQPYCL